MGKIVVSYSVGDDEEGELTINDITITMKKEQNNNQQLMGKKKEIEKEEPQKTLLLDQKIIKTMDSMADKAVNDVGRV